MRIHFFFIYFLCCVSVVCGQDSCVPPFPLVLPDGSVVTNAGEWESTGRNQWVQMFREQMQGYFPDVPVDVRYEVQDTKQDAIDAMAIRKLVRAVFSANGQERFLDMVMYIPVSKPLKGTFVGLNFWSNYTCFPDPDIPVKDWITGTQSESAHKNKDLESFRGMRVGRWPVQDIVSAGYALVTAHYGDLYLDAYPDTEAGYKGSVAEMLFSGASQVPDSCRGKAVATWAWGLSRMLDYVYTDSDFTAKNAVVIGHSRLGKTAIWAGVCDTRFGLVISNNSGSCGAAVARCKTGESLAKTNTVRPHWFCDNLKRYMDNEEAMPFDMNILLSLVAPRAVYVASASEDPGAAPLFEYKGIYYASPVYELYGYKGFSNPDLPAVGDKVWQSRMGFHLREGEHNITPYDWERYLEYADIVFKNEK